MKNIHLLGLGFLSLTTVQFSCEGFVQSLKDTKAGNVKQAQATDSLLGATGAPRSAAMPVEEERETNFLADPAALQAVEDALRQLPQLRGKAIYVYSSIHFYDNGRVLLKIQNPENSTYVDEYYYSNGEWAAPKPVVLSKHDKIDEDRINLDQIPFTNAHRAYVVLRQKLEEIGSRSTDYTVYVVTSKGKIRWYPRSISNDRSRYSIEFHADGSLKSFEQD